MKMQQFFRVVIFLLIALQASCQSNNVRLSDAVTPSLYTLFMTVETEFLSFNGTVSIDFTTNRATSEIEMHSTGLTINSAIIASDEIETESTYILSWNETEKITIGLGRTLARNTNHRVTIDFKGRMAHDDTKGLYRSSYYNGDNK